jgi:hypothetical protein
VKTEPTPDQIRQYMQKMVDQHLQDWREQVLGDSPHWVYLLAIHLRLIELEGMENAVQELL